MTRKDFEIIADTLHDYLVDMRLDGIGEDCADTELVDHFIASLKQTNPRFKTDRFEKRVYDGLPARERNL